MEGYAPLYSAPQKRIKSPVRFNLVIPLEFDQGGEDVEEFLSSWYYWNARGR